MSHAMERLTVNEFIYTWKKERKKETTTFIFVA